MCDVNVHVCLWCVFVCVHVGGVHICGHVGVCVGCVCSMCSCGGCVVCVGCVGCVWCVACGCGVGCVY